MVVDVYRKNHLGFTNQKGNDEGGLKTRLGTVIYFNHDGNSRFGCFAEDPDEMAEPLDYDNTRSRYGGKKPVDKEHVD